MKLIVGLGNPGEKYAKTRHNLGFMVVEQFLKDFNSTANTVWHDEPKFKSDISSFDWQPKAGKLEKVILVKPKTHMNNSGMAVQLFKDFYKIDKDDIWIIHDDIDLALGGLRIRHGGGHGGHRGVESILTVLGDGFWRFRMGIGRPDVLGNIKGVEDYVLGDFSGQEKSKISELIHRSSEAIQEGLENGLEVAMNKYNAR